MKQILLSLSVLLLLSACTLNTNEKTDKIITQSNNCTNCAVTGNLYIPEHNQTQLEVVITMWEYNPEIADVSAKEFDKITTYINQNTKQINFNLGQSENIQPSQSYYITTGGYVDNLYVFSGKCLHDNFCSVLEPSIIEINGEIQNKLLQTR